MKEDHRWSGIDAGRFASALAVVVIHGTDASLRASVSQDAPMAFVNEAMRFAVPYFLLVTGYFMARDSDRKPLFAIARILRRIVPVFVVWSVFYMLTSESGLSHVDDIPSFGAWLRTFVMQGDYSGFHLWFLPALVVCSVCLLLMESFLTLGQMLAVSALIYSIGLAVGSYRMLLLPDFHSVLINGRNGPFPLLFVVLGYCLAKWRARPSMSVSLAVLLLGGLACLLEAAVLGEFGISPIHRNDFLLGSIPFSLGVFFVALNLPESPMVKLLAMAGRYSLGVYASHLFFLRFAIANVGVSSAWRTAICCALAALLAWIASWAIGRVRQLRPLVA